MCKFLPLAMGFAIYLRAAFSVGKEYVLLKNFDTLAAVDVSASRRPFCFGDPLIGEASDGILCRFCSQIHGALVHNLQSPSKQPWRIAGTSTPLRWDYLKI
jgi:hypothetical protein